MSEPFLHQGDTQTHLVKTTSEYDPQSGWAKTQHYTGRHDDIKRRAAKTISDFTGKGYPVRASFSPTGNGDMAECSLTFADDSWSGRGGDDDTVDQWTISWQRRERPIVYAPFLSGLTPNQLQAINKYTANPALQSPYMTAADSADRNGMWTGIAVDQTPGLIGTPAAFNAAVTLIGRGVKEFVEYGCTVKKSGNYRTPESMRQAIGNVGKSFSIAQLSTFEGFPVAFRFVLPGGFYLKGGTSTSIEGTRLKVETEFERFDEIEAVLYPPATDILGLCFVPQGGITTTTRADCMALGGGRTWLMS